MSPEQCRGLKVDARADIYALGVLLYETLTGRLPFDGATPLDIWQAHAEKPPRPPIDIAPGAISPTVNAIILRLLAKKPEHRYQTAAEFCAALENLTEDGHPKNTPPPLRNDAAADEITTTIEDLPAVPSHEPISTEEERRKEIEDLRASLGLHIEEPAAVSDSSEQMSALVINLAPSAPAGEVRPTQRGGGHSIPMPAVVVKNRVSRPIEERKYVPPLAAPSVRPVTSRAGGDVAARPEAPARPRPSVGRILRIALVAALLLAATIVAIKFIQ
jgi:serine/threonine protein kinase